MSGSIIESIVIGIAVVAFIAYRQSNWRFVGGGADWRGPGILAIVGIVLIVTQTSTVAPLDVAFLVVEALLAVLAGFAMGRVTVFRRADRPERGTGRTIQARSGGVGIALWVVLIAVRVGLDVVGSSLGAHMVAGTGTILLMLALNRAARALVVEQRLTRAVALGA